MGVRRQQQEQLWQSQHGGSHGISPWHGVGDGPNNNDKLLGA